jgi:hypothetical protein
MKDYAAAVSLWGSLGTRYNVRETYVRAQQKHDPLLAPHGFFRRLAYKSNLHAREFLEQFGSLWLPSDAPTIGDALASSQMKIHLRRFWTRHRRFCVVARLWEARDDRKQLAEGWQDLENCRDEVSKFDVAGLGDYYDGAQYVKKKWPWELADIQFEKWVEESPTRVLRDAALALVHSELNSHVTEASVSWERGWEPTKTKFRQVVFVKDLWSIIWEFFGWDTAGTSWRRCPHCQRLFYPKRRDQFYCTPRQQALASKREYARRQRVVERHNAGRAGGHPPKDKGRR